VITIKKVFLVLLGLLIVGCGVETKTIKNPDGSSKTYQFLKNNNYDSNKYTLKLKNGTMNITIIKNGDKTYYKVVDNIEESVVVEKNYIRYTLNNNEKTYKKENIEGYKNYIAGYFPSDIDSIKNMKYETGKEKIGVLNYVYEKYSYEGMSIIYYFRGKKLRYIKNVMPTNETMVDFVSVSNKVDNSLFKIPSDYHEVEL